MAGYRIFYGTDGVNFPHAVDVGLTATPVTPSHTLTSFNVYGNLFFKVGAYDLANNLSELSSPAVSMAVAPKLMPLVWG